jgi:glycerol kinase
MKKYILAFDQGTTSSRSVLYDHHAQVVASHQLEFKQHYPRSGWVEHDANEIWETQLKTAVETLKIAGATRADISAIGITNQRETTVVWNRLNGEPIYNAIVWQDRRTSAVCAKLKQAGKESLFQEKTGLLLDPYFSGTKIQWILDNVSGARESAEKGELAFGTIDSWLIWKLTNGETHTTDVTNASRTLLFDIKKLDWSNALLNELSIPGSLLPKVADSAGVVAETKVEKLSGIPISGIAGDQHAALFGQQCFEKGTAKNTYGTGCFLLMNTGNEPIVSKNKLLTTVAWRIQDSVTYALEGSVFMAGATIQWLRDELQFFEKVAEVEALAGSVKDTGGIYLVPAFTGLGAPYWNPDARGTLVGMTRGTSKAHIARAALESIALQSYELLEAMESDSGITLKRLHVDGGAANNDLLMQFQADINAETVLRPKNTETTALGAALLAGLGIGVWKSIDDLPPHDEGAVTFEPDSGFKGRERTIANWRKAVAAAEYWASL